MAKLKELTSARGPDIILEMAAHLNLGKDFEVGLMSHDFVGYVTFGHVAVVQAVAESGTIVVVGSRGPTEVNARFLMMKHATVTGIGRMC